MYDYPRIIIRPSDKMGYWGLGHELRISAMEDLAEALKQLGLGDKYDIQVITEEPEEL